jgi:uncharacterized delta-60 repeat protein
MVGTLLALCLTVSGKAAKRSAPRRRPRFQRPSYRPRLETFEDRCLLSAGALDPTFGNGAGYVTTPPLTNDNDDAFSALIQPDGKIIAVGEADSLTKSHGLPVLTAAVALVRYNTDGSLDTSFGNGGTAMIGPAVDLDFIHAALYPTEGTANDGKIVVGGLSSGFAIARYNVNGTLDTSFGSNGIATANFGTPSHFDVGFEVIQPDGEIVALGQTADQSQAQMARFNPDGSLDTTFGQEGMVTGPVDPYSLLLQGDGKLVMVGARGAGAGMELARYNANGTLDTSFGTGGIVTNSSFSLASAGAIYPVARTANDGKIVVEGSGVAGKELELARYNPDGSLDTTFGTGGLMATPSGQIESNLHHTQGVVIQPDGRIVVAAAVPRIDMFAVARYNLDGSLDSSFGTGGIVTTSIGSSSPSTLGYSSAVALQSNGAIVVAGGSNNGTQDVFTVARYLGGPTSGPAFGVTGFPSSITAGTAATLTVTAHNADGSTNTGYTGTIHFTSSDPQAALPADYTFTAADQGVHTFSVTLKTAGFQSVNITDVSTGYSGEDGALTINPAAASSLIISGLVGLTQGTAYSFTVTAVDPYGNIATGYTGTVTFSTSDPLATLPANYTFTAADAGVHSFSVTFNTAGTESLTVNDTLDSALIATDTGITVTKKKGH